MSLTSALHTTYSGLSKTEAQISVVSSNVTNADKAGYTTKTYQSDYTTANGVTVPTSGTIVGSLDYDLYKAVIENMTDNSYYSTVAEYIEQYTNTLGTTDGDNTLSSYIDAFETTMSALETSPEDGSAKIAVVDAAETIARELQNLSGTVQDLRLQADQEIEQSVNDINALLENLDQINEKITNLTANAASTADVEDERMVILEELSGYLDISYYINNNNQMKVYTSSGQSLLDSQVHTLSYSSTNSVTGASIYPTDFSAIMVGTNDITASLQNGKLGALVELRDETLVAEQDKLDELARTLSETINTVLNEGASYPARSEIASELEGLALGDTFSATGGLRVSVVDADGMVQEIVDLDLSAYSNIGDLVTALDGISGMSASLDADGVLTITANDASEGIAFNQMDSSVGADSESFGMYFGLSNMFTGEGAEYIQVSDYLSEAPDMLSSSMLSNDAALGVGDIGVIAGDGTIATQLIDALNSTASFDAAGNFSSQNSTISSYTNKLIAYVANSSESAAEESDTAELLYGTLKTTMENQTGVNIDEETMKMVELETHYQASAVMLSTLQDMFDVLISAVN